MVDFWSTQDATLALARGLADALDLETEYQGQYSPSPYLQYTRRANAARVRDAIRFLCSEEADE